MQSVALAYSFSDAASNPSTHWDPPIDRTGSPIDPRPTPFPQIQAILPCCLLRIAPAPIDRRPFNQSKRAAAAGGPSAMGGSPRGIGGPGGWLLLRTLLLLLLAAAPSRVQARERPALQLLRPNDERNRTGLALVESTLTYIEALEVSQSSMYMING